MKRRRRLLESPREWLGLATLLLFCAVVLPASYAGLAVAVVRAWV